MFARVVIKVVLHSKGFHGGYCSAAVEIREMGVKNRQAVGVCLLNSNTSKDV